MATYSEPIAYNRDCFARFDYIRVTVHLDAWEKDTCEWCGSEGRKLSDGTRRLFAYGTDEDGLYSRPCVDYDHLFCSVGCNRIYNGE